MFQTCLDTNTTQIKRMAEKKRSISLHSAYIEYEPFAKELHKNPCIWDMRNDYYNLVEYRGLAFCNIETVLCLKCKCYSTCNWQIRVLNLWRCKQIEYYAKQLVNTFKCTQMSQQPMPWWVNYACSWIFSAGNAKVIYGYARANYRNTFVRYINNKELSR